MSFLDIFETQVKISQNANAAPIFSFSPYFTSAIYAIANRINAGTIATQL